MAVRMALGLVAVVALVNAALSAPTAAASPETDAYDAITAAWEAAGGDDSPVGAPDGDVYPAGAGFAQDFARGKMFFTPETGARALYGAVLDKYESLGGAANSDLGFPNTDEVAGVVNPDSRYVNLSAPDNPVIFYTPDHGAYVVRGPINAAWDKLGSSTSTVGVPVGDESYDGDVITQKFSNGEISWNGRTKAFTTVPPELAEQLADVQVQVDPAAAINQAWRTAGGASGPLGAKQGEQYQVGTDGVGQNFAGGRIYYSPGTGANAIEGDIAAKYESLGGPTGSDLGFPIANEADGSIPGSRFATFSGDDKPVIFFTPDNGAFVVRGAMMAAWDKLGGASGKLGAPVGDQTVEGDVVSQKFTGGKIFWNKATNTFSTEPSNLAKSLSGLQIPGMKTPNAGSSTSNVAADNWLYWHRGWLWIAIAALVVVAALAWAARWWLRRRRPAGDAVTAGPRGAARIDDHAGADEQWSAAGGGPETTVRLPSRFGEPPGGPQSEVDVADRPATERAWAAEPEGTEDSDDVDTDPTPVLSAEGEPGPGRHRVDDATGLGARPSDLGAGPTDFGGGPSDFGGGPADLGAGPADSTVGPVGSGAGTADSGAAPIFGRRETSAHPVVHPPLDDPYQPPEGYPVKANFGSGLYYTADSALYDDTLAEIWFASEEAAQRSGFVKAE
jgi:uncharacterized protein with LGFP repeats